MFTTENNAKMEENLCIKAASYDEDDWDETLFADNNEGAKTGKLFEDNKDENILRRSATAVMHHTNKMAVSLRSSLNKLKTIFTQPHSKKVVFGQVQINEMKVTLGDNPSCSHGPPITLSWSDIPLRRLKIDVEKFECCRKDKRRKGNELLLSRKQREYLCRKSGASLRQITDIEIANARLKIERKKNQRWMKFRKRLGNSLKHLVVIRR